MLVLNFKKRNCIEIKETNEILSVVGVFGSELVLKLGNGMINRHISEKKKNMQIGFKGSANVTRMSSKFKIKEKKEQNFDFDFDTEGY